MLRNVFVCRPCKSIRRHAEAALPEFAAAPLADVAAELVLGFDELGIVVVGAIAWTAGLGELGAVAQSDRADIEVRAWAAIGHFLQQLFANGPGEVVEIAGYLDEGTRPPCHAVQIVTVEIGFVGKTKGIGP